MVWNCRRPANTQYLQTFFINYYKINVVCAFFINTINVLKWGFDDDFWFLEHLWKFVRFLNRFFFFWCWIWNQTYLSHTHWEHASVCDSDSMEQLENIKKIKKYMKFSIFHLFQIYLFICNFFFFFLFNFFSYLLHSQYLLWFYLNIC